jgi:cobalt-zinc-cadmium efflux system membrane fusion protein
MPTPHRLFAGLLLGALAVCAAGCDQAASSAPPDEAPAAKEPSHTEGRVKLDPSQLAQVKVEELSTHAPSDVIRATGTVEFNADRMAKILPPVAGQVLNLTVNVGDTVKQGDVLFILSSREVAAAIADHVASQKDHDLAEKTYAMTKDLFDHQAASLMSLQQAENELAKAKSKEQQTEEILQVLGVDGDLQGDATQLASHIPIRATIAGTVIERTVTNGQFVGPDNPPLVSIADLSSVWVQADVFERDLRNISNGQRADVAAAAYPSDTFGAQVSRIGATVDAQTRTAKVRFLVANPGDRLKPGMFASISLYLPESTSDLTLPAKAVFVENGQSYAYVQTGQREFVRRPIESAASGSDRVRIVHGLVAGDHVVSDGVLLLRQLESDPGGQ